MEESVTYQAIVRKGYERGVREGVSQGRSEGLDKGLRLGEVNALLRIGTRRFGPPSAEIIAQIEAIAELDRLNLLLDRVTISDSWAALLAEE